jgi:uncharacterized membrane protein
MAMHPMQNPRSRAKMAPPESGRSLTNVGRMERWASVVGGGMLTFYGLAHRRSGRGLAATAAGGALLYRGTTGHCPAYGTLGVSTAQPEKQPSAIWINETVTIQRSREALYAHWRQLENLPGFMNHLETVSEKDEKHSHWQARGPEGLGTISWDAEITAERPGELLAWRSLPGADLETTGTVRFLDAPDGRGTEVHVIIEYRPPGGIVGAAAAGLLNPAFSQLIKEDVRRFKNLMETREVPTVEDQPAGR